jgi:hypothetical protein
LFICDFIGGNPKWPRFSNDIEQGFNNIGVLHGGLLRFVSKFEPAITAAAGALTPPTEVIVGFFCLSPKHSMTPLLQH